MGLISVSEAAAVSGMTPQHLRRLLKAGRIEGRQTGASGVWLVEEESLQAYLQQERRPGPKARDAADDDVVDNRF